MAIGGTSSYGCFCRDRLDVQPEDEADPGSRNLFALKTVMSRRAWIALLAVLALALAAGGFALYQSRAHSSKTSPSASKPAPQTIAVLPFHDISAVPSDTWAIGMTDAIISRLVALQNLPVRPTASVLRYSKELAEPGRQPNL